jgi:hypothetical protein
MRDQFFPTPLSFSQLGVVLKPHNMTSFTFRQFSGIAAMVERLFGSEFATAAENQVRQDLH